MSDTRKVPIKRLRSGVPRLDDILGGGIPEFSFNLIVGEPGSGKTTLAHQFMFANATAERPALYFTVLGEPTLKMLRYQQQFSFFDPDKVGQAIQFVNLSQEALEKDLGKVLASIIAKVEEVAPAIVIVDSFRTLVRTIEPQHDGMDLQQFVQRLAMQLTTWQATTLLIGEYAEVELRENPVFTMADGIVWLTQSVNRNSMVRKVQIPKMRGQSPQPGLHTVRISDDGVQMFPRMIRPVEEAQSAVSNAFISMGVAGLDQMLGGGTLTGSSILVAGPSGCGKTTLAIQFIAEGVKHSEPGVIALFEETTPKYLEQARGFGVDLNEMIAQGLLEMVYIRPLDLSVDETLYAIQAAVDRIGARRVALDSLSGLEAALAPTFKEDFRESLYRLLGALTGVGISILMTVEVNEAPNDMRFTPHAISFLTHDIILQRYVEIEGQLRTVMTVIKTRGRRHSPDFRAYVIGDHGLEIGERLAQYSGIITAVPQLREAVRPLVRDGLTDRETIVALALRDADGLSFEELRDRTGLDLDVVKRAIERMVELRYATREDRAGTICFSAITPPPPLSRDEVKAAPRK